jgi:hypothetical protein
MLYAFTDESYNNHFYLQGALIVEESELVNLDHLAHTILSRARAMGVSEIAEIHGHSIMQGVHGWEALAGKLNLRLGIYKQLLKGISGLRATLLIQGVEIQPLKERFGIEENPHFVTYRNLLDSIEFWAILKEEQITIISDRISYEAKLMQLFAIYQIESTKGKYHNHLKSIIKVEHIDSHLSAGVQLVDSVLYIYNRLMQKAVEESRAGQEVKDLWQMLQPLIHHGFEPRIWSP